MKHFFFLLLCFVVASTSFAQADTVHITLTAYQHTVIIAYMQDKGQAEKSKYLFTVLPQIDISKDGSGKNILTDPGKNIQYSPTVEFLGSLFMEHGSNQERLVAADNRTIQLSLQQQLQRRPDVLQRIGELVAANAAQNAEVIQVSGIDYLAKLKQ